MANGTLVEFDKSLDVAMAKLRHALGDSSSSPLFIATVPKRGYQFVAPLRVPEPLPVTATKPSALTPPPPSPAAASVEVAARAHDSYDSRMRAALVAVVSGVATMALLWLWHCLLHPRLAERAVVVVGAFTNATGDASFDRSLRTAAAINFAQSPYLTVLSDEKTADTLQVLGRPPDDGLDPAITREVCQQEHAAATITGNIQRAEAGYLLTLLAHRCSDGSILATVGHVIGEKQQALTVLGTATAELRRKLGESLDSLKRYNVTVLQATTNSLEALKAYQRGMDLRSHARNIDAIPEFKASIELDPTFAMAYAQLGSSYSNVEATRLASQYFQEAFELRERATEPERLYIAGRYFDIVTGEMERGSSISKLWTQIYPNDWRGYNGLSNNANMLGRYEIAAEAAAHAIALEPNHAYGYTDRAIALLALNRSSEALAVAREAIRLGHDGGVLHAVLYSVALINADQSGLLRERAWSTQHPDEMDVPFAEAQAAEAQGRIADSDRLFSQLAARARRLGFAGYAQSVLAQEAVYDVEMGLRDAALAHARAAKDSDTEEFALELLALAYSRLNMTGLARSLNDELDHQFPLSTFNISVFGPTIRTAMAMSGDISAAQVTDAMKPARPYEMGRQAVLNPTYIRGVAYLKAHAMADAEHEFQKILDHPGVDSASPFYPLAQLGLARAYASEGRVSEARRAYELLVEKWKDADPSFPLLSQMKKEFKSLN